MTSHVAGKTLAPFLYYRKTTTLPSVFLNKQRQSTAQLTTKGSRCYTYDRDIILLPNAFRDERGLIKIPRSQASRESLAANGLVGKIRLSSDMTELRIFDKIRAVFSSPMNNDEDFPVKILQTSGGSSKTLTISVISSSYRWTAGSVAGKNAKCPIYVLAEENLKVAIYVLGGRVLSK